MQIKLIECEIARLLTWSLKFSLKTKYPPMLFCQDNGVGATITNRSI